MQIMSRDLARPENLKSKTATVYTNSNLTGLVKMVTGNRLCVAFINFVFGFNNKRHYVLVPSPLIQVISFFRLLF